MIIDPYPKNIVSYSTDELNRFYAKDDGTNTEYEIGFENIATSATLPLYLNSDTIGYNRGAVKCDLATDIDEIKTDIEAEKIRLDAVDVLNTTNLSSLQTTVDSVLNLSTDDLNSFSELVNDYTTVSGLVATALTTEITDARAAESLISDALVALDTMVSDNYTALTTNNTTTLTQITTNTVNLVAEETRALAAEAVNTGLIETLKNNTETDVLSLYNTTGTTTTDLTSLTTAYDATVVEVTATLATLDGYITNNYNLFAASQTASLNSRKGQLLSYHGETQNILVDGAYPFSFGDRGTSNYAFGMMIPCNVKLKRFCFAGNRYSSTYDATTRRIPSNNPG